jgi:osmoprotectant transport system substrate-binding protein
VPSRDTEGGQIMRTAIRLVAGLVLGLALTSVAACGGKGSSGTKEADKTSGAGCAPVAGTGLVVLTDDKKLQTADNIVPAIYGKAANPALTGALDKVSDALDTPKLVGLNKDVDVDRKSPENAAADFAAKAKLTEGLAKGPGGPIIIGAANFSENQTLANLYKIVLTAAGYTPTVQQIGNRELYEPDLEAGKIQVVPEYAGTFTEFLNKKVNGANAAPIASGDLDKTVTALKDVGGKKGLVFGKASQAADQNAFAVTKAFADKNSVKTLSEFAAKCSGSATVLGGPPECPQRPFCQPGLEQTYNLKVGRFASLDSGGPQTKNALKSGTITVGLVLSSDGALASG